jgi:N-formylglutamate deformylase
VQARLVEVLQGQRAYDWVVNGRFKGGYITRHYGDPAHGIDAVQLEISQRIYMDEDSFAWDETRAGSARSMLRRLLEAVL